MLSHLIEKKNKCFKQFIIYEYAVLSLPYKCRIKIGKALQNRCKRETTENKNNEIENIAKGNIYQR